MEKFSEKSLLALGECYVYGLIDPRNRKLFYIGKGTGNRVFEHENESLNNPDSEKLKLKTIASIHSAGLEVEKIIINCNLSENEAFAAEAALINALNYIGNVRLSNIVAGHHSAEALTVEDFEIKNGAEELKESDIKHKVMIIKINKLYSRNMSDEELYDIVRGIWKASLERAKSIDYVFGVYKSLIVAVYKPTQWYRYRDQKDKMQRADIETVLTGANRIFFCDENYETGKPLDKYQEFYLYKSIAALKINQNAQNPITYIEPINDMRC